MKNLLSKEIKLFAMDVDGTLTDGKINISSEGELFKSFSVKDGFGIRLLQSNGIIPAIITTRYSKIVEKRARELDITEVHQGIKNKDVVLRELAEKYEINLEQIAFIGDDYNDFEAIEIAGVSFAPADCADSIREHVDIVLKTKAGEGAAREAIEMIISKD